MKIILMILAVLMVLAGMAFSTCVNAQSVTVSGTHPITRTDGAALDIAEIDRYEVGCSSVSNVGPFEDWRFIVPRDSLIDPGHQEIAPMDSTWHCIAMTVDTGGLVSPPSNVVTTEWKAPPGPLEDLQFSCYGECNTTLNFNITITP